MSVTIVEGRPLDHKQRMMSSLAQIHPKFTTQNTGQHTKTSMWRGRQSLHEPNNTTVVCYREISFILSLRLF